MSWISWFCSLRGNEFFVEVDEEYIQDDFNLSGLGGSVPYYDYALDCILDADGAAPEALSEAQAEVVESAAEVLYGFIHARFLVTARGLAALASKMRAAAFGRCPRIACEGQPCLPVGLSDAPRVATVKLYCPRCRDVFHPRSRRAAAIDGAFFGTTAAHLLLMTHPALRPEAPGPAYVPRVWGFRVNKAALAPPSAVRAAQAQAQRQAQQQARAAIEGAKTPQGDEPADDAPGAPSSAPPASAPADQKTTDRSPEGPTDRQAQA